MFGPPFYHEHTRRAVAVFGSLFNDISVVKRDGKGNFLRTIKIPLSYGPRQKFLARIKNERDLEDSSLAIKLPRMSFEITSISYDADRRLQRGTKYKIPSSDSEQGQRFTFYPSTYTLGFELSIMSRHTEDSLQILEQILPFFQPEYTVTVFETDNNFRSDMPFTLTDVSMTDDYEGDFLTRRSIIYNLSFETKINYYGPVYPTDGSVQPDIREVKVDTADMDMESEGVPGASTLIRVVPKDASPDDFGVEVSVDPNLYDRCILEVTSVTGSFKLNETVVGANSGAVGKVSSIDGAFLTIIVPDDRFEVSETLTGESSGATGTITSIEEIWDTAP